MPSRPKPPRLGASGGRLLLRGTGHVAQTRCQQNRNRSVPANDDAGGFCAGHQHFPSASQRQRRHPRPSREAAHVPRSCSFGLAVTLVISPGSGAPRHPQHSRGFQTLYEPPQRRGKLVGIGATRRGMGPESFSQNRSPASDSRLRSPPGRPAPPALTAVTASRAEPVSRVPSAVSPTLPQGGYVARFR